MNHAGGHPDHFSHSSSDNSPLKPKRSRIKPVIRFFNSVSAHDAGGLACCMTDADAHHEVAAIACSQSQAALLLAERGVSSVLLLSPPVRSDDLRHLADTVRLLSSGRCPVMANSQSADQNSPVVTVCIDHFRHAELLADIAEGIGVQIDVLIEVDLGHRFTGVRPGPDSVRLAAGIQSLPSLRLRGVYVDDRFCEDTDSDVLHNSESGTTDASGDNGAFEHRERSALAESFEMPMSFDQSITIAGHCRRMIEASGFTCREIVTGLQFSDAAVRHADVTTALKSGWEVTVPLPDSSPPVCSRVDDVVTACVISRPSLEWCVIDVSVSSLQLSGRSRPGCAAVPAFRVISPAGAEVLHQWDSRTSLGLSGDALDLRIGDYVRVQQISSVS